MNAQQLAFWGRAVAAWLLIAAVETVHGVARGLWLVPALGEVAAQRLGFELAIGRARGFGWERIAAEFDPRQGGFMLFALLLMGLAPMLGAWLRGPRRM